MEEDLSVAEMEAGKLELPASPVARVISLFGWLGVIALFVPIVLTCADIAWRRVVGGAFVDTFDLTKLSLVAAAALSIPYGFVHGSHVTVDLLFERAPARARAIGDAAIHGASALLFAFLTWLAWNGAVLHYSYGDTTQNLEIPITYYWAIFIFGLVLAIVACLWRITVDLATLRDAREANS